MEEPRHPASLDEAIIKSAARHGIPESLVRRIVMRESKYNPLARNHKYWGLMQISYPTAKSMGFRGTPQELLNPVVNLRYAVPYLANAFIIAGKQQDAAVRLYAAGYYDTAKRRGLLGMLRTADSAPLSGVPDEPDNVVSLTPPAPPPQDTGIFGGLFGPQQMQREQPQVAAADPAQVAATLQPATAASASAFAARSEGPVRQAERRRLAGRRQARATCSRRRNGSTTAAAPSLRAASSRSSRSLRSRAAQPRRAPAAATTRRHCSPRSTRSRRAPKPMPARTSD